MEDTVSVGFYSPSYKRPTTCKTHLVIPNLTYVVRSSEYSDYKVANDCNVIGVDDELIDCNTKARQWIIDNATEDIVVMFDDDFHKFVYRIKECEDMDNETMIDEVYRMCQIVYDLGIGMGGVSQNLAPFNYHDEFIFNKVVGGFVIINKSRYKAQMDLQANFKEDTDKTLQELLHNRIVLYTNYICSIFDMDTNAGGDQRSKTKKLIDECNVYMKEKWGKYYNYVDKTNTVRLKIKR